MPAVVNLTGSQLESYSIKNRTVKTLLTFTTAATAAGIVVASSNPGVVPFYTAGSATPTAPTGSSFGSLTNSSGSVIGLYIYDGDSGQNGKASAYLGGVFSFTSDLTPSITAVVPVKCGAASTGITTTGSTGNVAVTLGLTGLTLLATATTQKLWCTFDYEVTA
jgi:energy-converting hydrogenase Eha subunit H